MGVATEGWLAGGMAIAAGVWWGLGIAAEGCSRKVARGGGLQQRVA